MKKTAKKVVRARSRSSSPGKSRGKPAGVEKQAAKAEIPPQPTEVGEGSTSKPARAPRSGSCRPFVRKQLAKALPDLCEAMLSRAREGDLSTLKMLWQMAELDKADAAGEQKKDRRFARQTLEKFRSR